MKFRIGLSLALALLAVHVFGQSDNMVHVKSFPGSTVGIKVTSAMATCGGIAGTSPCILVIDASLANFPSGLLPTLCGTCYLVDYRNGPPSGGNINGQAVTPTKVNGVYYANEWCTTLGTLDDTCFTNAIADIATNGPTGIGGHRYGTIIVPPGLYQWKAGDTVTLPVGVDISITGERQTSVWGPQVQAGSANQAMFTVLADNVGIDHLAFLNGSSYTGIVAIQMGSATQTTFDSHINWNWFFGEHVAFHLFNTSGDDLSHNTFDAGTDYGIYSSQAAGDVQANDIIADDLRSYGQIETVYINAGTAAASAYSSNQFRGLFTDAIDASTNILLINTINNSISGTFNNDSGTDIGTSGTIGTNIGPFSTSETGLFAVQSNGDTGLAIHDGTIVDPGQTSSGPANAAIAVGTGTGVSISSINSSKRSGSTVYNSYGLYVASSSTGTALSALNFNAQTTAATDILDTTVTGMTAGAVYLNGSGCTSGTYVKSDGTGCGSGGSGSFVWPSLPGIPNCTGTPCTAWGTTYSASNLIPANFVSTLNQPTTGTAGNVTATSNATLTTLSSLSLPIGQVTGTINATQVNGAAVPSSAKATGTNSSGQVISIDYPEALYIPAANCNNVTAGAAWSIGSSGTAACRGGTNNLGGYVAITDTSGTFAQFSVPIPQDWDSSSLPYIRFQLAYPGTDGGSSHTIIPQIKVACTNGTSGAADDPTLQTAHSSSTITLSSATANLYFSTSNMQLNSTDMTNCVAGSLMIIQVGRATDTATSAANFYGATLTIPRQIVMQAN